jgi:hypothetical protein
MAGKAVGHRHEPDRELARALLTADGDQLDRTYLATHYGAAIIRSTRQELERSQLSLQHHEPKLNGSLTKPLRDALCAIGAKIRPDLSADQASAWVEAMLLALSDLPPHVAAKAVARAIHLPFLYPSEVETKVRGLAGEHLDAIRRAIHRAQQLEDMIRKAAHPPQPQLTSHYQDGPLSLEEIHELQRKGLTAVIKLGLANGHITEDQLLPPDDPTLSQEEAT